jgi:hypothetical protein
VELAASKKDTMMSEANAPGSSTDSRRAEPGRGWGEGEEMTDNDAPAASPNPHVNFDAPAALRKWPSLNNERHTNLTSPYLILDGTLDECIREFMAKPARSRHLYEIHTSPQPPLVTDVLSGEIVSEVARLREFL